MTELAHPGTEYLPAPQTFDDMLAEQSLWTFDSEDLVDKSMLVGVPFIITEVAFRYTELPDPANPKLIVSKDYVSVTGRVASQAWLDKARARVTKLGFAFPDIDPEVLVVFNDGSTGVRRQLVAILNQAKLIDIGEGDAAKGNAVFDRPFFDWKDAVTTEDGEMVAPNITTDHQGRPLIIKVLKGLRISEYAYGTQTAVTYYLS